MPVALALLCGAGCFGQELPPRNSGEVNSYRAALGLQEAGVVKIFGERRAKRVLLPEHDPETYSDGLEVITESGTVLLTLQDGAVSSVLFQSAGFKTGKGVSTGQKYHEVLRQYPDAGFSFEYADGVSLQLQDDKSGIIFVFDASWLPLDKYIAQGDPDRDSASLREAVLETIILKR